MSERAIIVGMNNPHSDSPRSALLPYPKNSAGWRLWKMCHDVSGVSRAEFRRSLEFVNLCDARVWCPLAARRKWEALESAYAGRTVVMCGRLVLAASWRTRGGVGRWYASGGGGRWCYIPHPSGLNREYNDPLLRLVVGLRLEELVRG